MPFFFHHFISCVKASGGGSRQFKVNRTNTPNGTYAFSRRNSAATANKETTHILTYILSSNRLLTSKMDHSSSDFVVYLNKNEGGK